PAGLAHADLHLRESARRHEDERGGHGNEKDGASHPVRTCLGRRRPHHGGRQPHHGGQQPHHGGRQPHHGRRQPHHERPSSRGSETTSQPSTAASMPAAEIQSARDP